MEEKPAVCCYKLTKLKSGGFSGMSKQQLKADGLKSLEAFIGQFDDKQSALLKVLYEAQRIFGYLSREVMLFISEKLEIPASKVYGVVSFYSYFATVPKGRAQVKVCTGTACFVRGAQAIADQFSKELGLKMGETTPDRKFSLEGLRCVGACGLAPLVLVGEKVYGKISVDDVSKIISEHQ